MPLKYGPFAASAGIRNAARNSPPLAFGATGSAVAILQGALLDVFGHEFSLDFEYCFFDRYNWDKGRSVTIFDITVTDEFMGEFHRQGVAREFDCVGSIRRKLTWRKGQPLSKDQLTNPIGGRA